MNRRCLRNLTTILRLEKFRPYTAQNGRVGIDLAKKQKPDLILCDVDAGLDGYGVIAASGPSAETVPIPFIFLTAKLRKKAIHSRLERAQAVGPLKPNFHSAVPSGGS